MELTVKARNGKITDRQRQHIESKLSKLDRFMDKITSVTVEVHTEQQRGLGEVHRVQATLVGDHGVILRAEEQSGELYSAIDAVEDVLERQIKRYKEKFWRRTKQRRQEARMVEMEAPPVAVAAAEEEEEAVARQVIRTKQFKLRPMFTDDAIEQMELLGHSFFVFQDAESSRLSVLYRRRDGNYGLIVPDGV